MFVGIIQCTNRNCGHLGWILLWSGVATAMYESNPDVIDLTEVNFDEKVVQSKEVWIVEFYAPWCGHCQQLVPEYSKAAKALKVCIRRT